MLIPVEQNSYTHVRVTLVLTTCLSTYAALAYMNLSDKVSVQNVNVPGG
jgi:hypothetical protein